MTIILCTEPENLTDLRLCSKERPRTAQLLFTRENVQVNYDTTQKRQCFIYKRELADQKSLEIRSCFWAAPTVPSWIGSFASSKITLIVPLWDHITGLLFLHDMIDEAVLFGLSGIEVSIPTNIFSDNICWLACILHYGVHISLHKCEELAHLLEISSNQNHSNQFNPKSNYSSWMIQLQTNRQLNWFHAVSTHGMISVTEETKVCNRVS